MACCMQACELTHNVQCTLNQFLGSSVLTAPLPPQANYVLHIFPPCEFSEQHLSRVAPDLLSSASDSGHLMVVVATSTAQTQ